MFKFEYLKETIAVFISNAISDHEMSSTYIPIRLYHFTHVYQKSPKIIWCTVPEIRSETEYFFILGHFLPFYLLTTWKIKILKIKKKKCLEMSSFYIWVPKITIIWCVLPEIWNVTDKIIGQFGPLIINYSFIIKMATKMKHGMWWLLDYLVNFYFIYFFSSAMTYTSVL